MKLTKRDLIKVLRIGINNYIGTGNSYDIHFLSFNGTNAVCKRKWNLDDGDMNDDSGESSARIKASEVDVFLDDLLRTGKAETVFLSVNSFHSTSRYEESSSPTSINCKKYEGQVLVKMHIEQDKVGYKFVPSAPKVPAEVLEVRLIKGQDYL